MLLVLLRWMVCLSCLFLPYNPGINFQKAQLSNIDIVLHEFNDCTCLFHLLAYDYSHLTLLSHWLCKFSLLTFRILIAGIFFVIKKVIPCFKMLLVTFYIHDVDSSNWLCEYNTSLYNDTIISFSGWNFWLDSPVISK